jgi:hypothetical protein
VALFLMKRVFVLEVPGAVLCPLDSNLVLVEPDVFGLPPYLAVFLAWTGVACVTLTTFSSSSGLLYSESRSLT